jgi:hypothetical protein
MPTVTFTPNLQRHVICPPRSVSGQTVIEALNDYFRDVPAARGYVLDEHGALRKHMTIFVDGQPVRDRTRLTDDVAASSEVFVFQALSGG